jgi:hypothetical protein
MKRTYCSSKSDELDVSRLETTLDIAILLCSLQVWGLLGHAGWVSQVKTLPPYKSAASPVAAPFWSTMFLTPWSLLLALTWVMSFSLYSAIMPDPRRKMRLPYLGQTKSEIGRTRVMQVGGPPSGRRARLTPQGGIGSTREVFNTRQTQDRRGATLERWSRFPK